MGAGVELNLDHVVMKLTPHGPAELAGIMVGDKLIQIDEQSLQQLRLVEVAVMIAHQFE